MCTHRETDSWFGAHISWASWNLCTPLPTVMEIMGWPDASIAKRYMYVPSEFLAPNADQVGGWSGPRENLSTETATETDGRLRR